MEIVRVGRLAPAFSLACVDAQDERRRSTDLESHAGRWLLMLFYPRDFSFVCPTELTAFSDREPEFRQRGCDLLGISVDSIDLHREWLRTSPVNGGLGPLRFPLASDPDGATARAYGVWVDDKQVSNRGLFLVDPQGVLQYAVIHNLNVGRSPDEVLRVLDALQTGALCPASWTSADGTIDPERALQPGRILGHYRIQTLIGGGAFGSVFVAWDLRLERKVALKVLRRTVFEARSAALAEARAAARVNHPNVCTVYAVEEEDGLPLIVMEYLAGHTLAQLIGSGLTAPIARQLEIEIASGVAAAHARQIVHGDLKPANVVVTTDGIAKVLDFGLAGARPARRSAGVDRRSESAPCAIKAGLTRGPGLDETLAADESLAGRESGIQGTPAYMSPEQAAGQRATTASDVFAFGLILFEMLSGQKALSDTSLGTILARLQTQDLGARLAPRVPTPYRDLLKAMLARVPGERPTMAEVVQRLSSVRITNQPDEQGIV